MLPSGANFTIERHTPQGLIVATITEVGAGLRALRIGGVDIVQDYPTDAPASLGAGLTMAPWPNRVRDGRWTLNGHVEQLAITEPKHGNALHGLLFFQPYRVVDRSLSQITLQATIYPQPGYPFTLATTVRYSIERGGLRVRHSIANCGMAPAPVAVGSHPYFRIGDVPTGELRLTCDAASVFDNDERFLPIVKRPVAGRDDLHSGPYVGELALDHCFTDLASNTVRLDAPDGRWVEVWMDENFGHVVLLTTDSFIAEDGKPRLAVAIEPQTCAIDALNTGEGLAWVQPAATWHAEWGVTARLEAV